ncbi:MAG: F0F1 ATP synthase subunit B [Oscillospiraceae bacterium]|nr:F0F1 ATP synthase subunit B [Oscillospiraceae bacterium]
MAQFEAFIGVNFWTALFTLLNTLTIFFVARHFLFRPVMKIIKDRQKEIDGMYSDADTAKGEANAMRNEYQQKLANAQATSDRIVKEAVARGQSRQEEIIRQAQQEASAIMDKASADIELERKKAINDAKNEISGIAIAIAGKVVGRELNEKDQAALVDHFIDELGDDA